MKTKRVLATDLLALTLTFVADQAVLAAGPGPFLPGEILVNEYSGNSVQRYSATGTLLQTFTGPGTLWSGVALTPDGNLVAGHRGPSAGIEIFSPAGTQLASFAVTGVGNINDVSVFPNGTLAVSDFTNKIVQFWSQAGAQGPTVALPGVPKPQGSTVGSDGILYVAGYTTNNLARVSAGGVSLGNVSLTFQPGDLVMNPMDGTLWVSGFDNDRAYHITTTGTLLGSFPTGLTGHFGGIGLAPDDNSLYVTSDGSTVVKHFDLSGGLLGSFALTSPNLPFFMTVVPAPEPTSAALLGLGALWLAARRRRSAQI